MEVLEHHEVTIRLGIFVGSLAIMMAFEALWPKRPRVLGRLSRWFTNFSITAVGAILIRLMAMAALPLSATAAAVWAGSRGIGVLHLVEFPPALEIVLALAVLDASIWFQHLASHRIGFLWRFHRVHHADRDIDASTALRFHPIEIGLSMLYKVLVVLAIGPSLATVIVFEIALNGLAIFNHSNVRLPHRLDKLLRLVLVTPDVHRVHHSVYRNEHDSNYGFSTTLWDRLFRTFVAQPRDGHRAMTIGLRAFQSNRPQELKWSLLLPIHDDVCKREPQD